jgi:hypothetical protein
MEGCCLLGLLAWTAAFAPADSLYGTVRDGLSRSPLAAARVELVNRPHASVTNGDGEYAFPTSAPGQNTLRVTRTGYDTVLVDAIVTPGRSLRVDVALHRLPTPLPPLEVSVVPARPFAGEDSLRWRGAPQVGLRSYDPETLRRDPLVATRDPVLAIAGGAVSGAPADFPSAVHLRGGSGDQNLVLLDGLPVYGLMHLAGAGSIFNPDAVSRVDVSTAGRPAGPGGRLSSTIAVALRPAGSAAATLDGGIDQSAVGQTVGLTSADGAASLLLSGRRSYRGVLSQTVGDNGRANGFEDYLARGSLGFGRDRIDLYLLSSTDRVGFSAVSQDESIATGGTQRAGDNSLNRFDWSNHTGGLVWRHPSARGRELTVRAWHAGSVARIGWPATPGAASVHSELRDLGGSAELIATGAAFRRSVGVSGQSLDLTYDVAGTEAAAVTSGALAQHTSPVIFGAWIDEERRLGQRLTLAMGIRANLADRFGASLDPRLSGRWALSRSLAILLGYDRTHQYVQSTRNEESLLGYAFGADLPVVGLAGGQPARADQLSAGLEARVGRSTTVRLDAYTRWFDHLAIVPAATDAPFAAGAVPTGSGAARGIELDVTHHGERFDARVAAGLADTRRRTATAEFSPGAGRGRWLSAGVHYRVGALATLGLAGSYASGSATSIVEGDLAWRSPGGLASAGEISGSPGTIVGGLNASRLPSWFRVDLGISRDWSLGAAARPRRISTSLTLINLFDRGNALGLTLDPTRRSLRTLLYPGRSLIGRVTWHF